MFEPKAITPCSDKTKQIPGSRHYIHAEDVANALIFLFNYDISKIQADISGIKCQKFNIVGKDEINNLELAEFIAKIQKKSLSDQILRKILCFLLKRRSLNLASDS